MAANPQRRAHVSDAALDLLAESGSRGVTHRAVDARARVPIGTCANYFPRRADLMVGIAERVFDVLRPDGERVAGLDALEGIEAVRAYAEYAVERLLSRPAAATALIELRLEAARTPAVGDRLAPFLRAGLDADTDFHTSRGLPGGRELVVLLHHVVDGVVLDALTTPLDPDADPARVASDIAARLVR